MFFVSYPRSGCIWIQAIFEIYFKRPRLPLSKGGITWLKEEEFYKTPIWTHTHDKNLDEIPSGKDILLVRNPVDVIYSYCLKHPQLTKGLGGLNKDNIFEKTNRLKKFLIKWEKEAFIKIKYENFLKKETAIEEMQKVVEHLGEKFDKQKAIDCYKKLQKKETIVEKNKGDWHGEELLKTEYKENREKFRKKWGQEINKKIINI